MSAATTLDTTRRPAAYQPPAFARPIDLDLSRNECRAVGDVSRLIADAPNVAKYPSAASLERAIAERFNVAPERVLVTAGADDGMDRVIRFALTERPGGVVLTHDPTFEMIPICTARAGGRMRACMWLDGSFPEQALLDALNVDAALLALVTPNNPTGRIIERDVLLRVIDRTAACGVPILVDLAYIEFTDDDPTSDLLLRPNVVVARTFSKAWGLAGLRVGYMLGDADRIASLRALGAPFAVSSLSAHIAEVALRTRKAEMCAAVRDVRGSRDRIMVALLDLGVSAIDGAANFVLARFDDVPMVWSELARRGVGVRRFDGAPALADRLRITVPPDRRDVDRLIAALNEILAPERQETTP